MVLVPRIESIPWFNGTAPGEYNHFHCSVTALSNRKEPIPEICQKYYNSIGAYVFDGAICK